MSKTGLTSTNEAAMALVNQNLVWIKFTNIVTRAYGHVRGLIVKDNVVLFNAHIFSSIGVDRSQANDFLCEVHFTNKGKVTARKNTTSVVIFDDTDMASMTIPSSYGKDLYADGNGLFIDDVSKTMEGLGSRSTIVFNTGDTVSSFPVGEDESTCVNETPVHIVGTYEGGFNAKLVPAEGEVTKVSIPGPFVITRDQTIEGECGSPVCAFHGMNKKVTVVGMHTLYDDKTNLAYSAILTNGLVRRHLEQHLLSQASTTVDGLCAQAKAYQMSPGHVCSQVSAMLDSGSFTVQKPPGFQKQTSRRNFMSATCRTFGDVMIGKMRNLTSELTNSVYHVVTKTGVSLFVTLVKNTFNDVGSKAPSDILFNPHVTYANNGSIFLEEGMYLGEVHERSTFQFTPGHQKALNLGTLYRSDGVPLYPQSAKESKLKSSPLRPLLESRGFVCSKNPPVMSGNKTRQNAISRLSPETNLLPHNLVLSATNACIAHFVEKLADKENGAHRFTRKLTDEEVVNGVDGLTWLDGVDMNTSMGFPWYGKKRNVFSFDGNTQKWMCPQFIWDRIKVYETNYMECRRSNPIFTASFKDQAVSEEKVQSKDTRIIFMAPVDFGMLCRKYFGMLMVLLQCHTNIFCSYPGTNVESSSWTDMGNLLRKYKYLFDGDYSKFDCRVFTDFATRCVILIFINLNVLMQDPEHPFDSEDIAVMKGIGEDLANPMVNYFGDLLQTMSLQASGNNPLSTLTL